MEPAQFPAAAEQPSLPVATLTDSNQVMDSKVPSIAAWLGGLGAAPFIFLAGAMPLLPDDARLLVADALAGYGAVILSFLGGVHWGLAIGAAVGAPGGVQRPRLSGRLIVSVLPSLAGWVALLAPETIGLFILAVAIAAMLWVDLRATRAGEAPPWYPKLRIPLTIVVVTTLVIGAFASKV
jgi:hypothetical protein